MMIENLNLAPIVGVGVMIFDDIDQVLLGLRIKAGEEASWCFPGGKIEAGESYEQSALREVFEETGLKLEEQNIKPFTLLINQSSPVVNTTVGLSCQLHNNKMKAQIVVTEPDIFDKWAWFSLSDLPSNLFPASEAMLNVWKEEKLHESWISYPIMAWDHRRP
ncbi:nucleotide triphosphate diphosphatase NUDT15 [Acinetobacter sp. ESBL14]|uniref:nucleotide triphosphate diphosphatase NUDT15 n=1 Tax=Acinetobacter sp. ESBL14 TaxID=3077329 RepID=UPI002FC797C3